MAVFNFLEKIARGDKKKGGGVFGFLETVARGDEDEGGGVFGSARRARDIGVSAGRGVLKVPETASRSYIEAIQDVADLIPGAPARREDHFVGGGRTDSASPTDPIRRLAYGSEPVETYQTRQQGYEDVLEKSRFREAATPLSLLGIGTTVGMDLIPQGKGGKDLAKELIKAKSAGEVKKALAKQLPDSIIDRVAPALAKTKDPNVISNIIERASGRIPASQIKNVPSAPLNQVDDVVDETVQSDPFDEILGAVRGQPAAPGQAPVQGIASARAEQTALLRKERGERFAASKGAGATAEGSEGYFRELGALKGEYSKVNFEPMIGNIGPERAEEIFTLARQKVNNTPDDFYDELGLHAQGARLNTQTAIRKVLGLQPGLPTKSELRLLEAYSPKLAGEVKNSLPVGQKIMNAAGTLFGNIRSAKTTLDLSMGGRQGLFVAARHPVTWAKANVESVKYAKNSKYFKQEMQKIGKDAWGKLGDEAGLALTAAKNQHEEAFAATDILASDAAKKVGVGHLVAGSERAYDGGLTKLRYDLWRSRLQAFGDTPEEAAEAIGQKGLKSLAEAVNTLTGRGGKQGGFVAKHATTLQEALFSPRLWASRLQPLNPAFWNRLEPVARKEAMESLGSFAAVAGLTLSAAAAAGAEVETDPRSSDFLKIKVGDTRYDILGGFQQNLVFGWRQLVGETKSSQTGRVTEFGENYGGPTRLTALFDAVRNKANPILGTGATILEGKDKSGEPVNPLLEIGKLFVPIGVENINEQIQDNNTILDKAKAVAKISPEFVGVGSQTYGLKDVTLSKSQKTYVEKLKSKGASEKQIEASERFYQHQKTGPDRKEASEQIKEALASGDQDKAVKIAKDYNAKYKSNFDDWRKEYGEYRQDEQLVKDYRSKLITDASFDRWISALEKE